MGGRFFLQSMLLAPRGGGWIRSLWRATEAAADAAGLLADVCRDAYGVAEIQSPLDPATVDQALTDDC